MPSLQLRTRTGGKTNLTPRSIENLKQHLRGELILPSHPNYEELRRVYNAMHDPHPAMIALAVGDSDVQAAVRFARETEIDFAVRGGGHSVPGFGSCDGGLVIDLRRMRGIRVDPEKRIARAEGGCTWADLNQATHEYGMAVTGGIVSTTGIGGLTLGGGMGYLLRPCGLSCDNVLSADVVTASGDLYTCSQDQHPDLFWAIRGGGGNFGVVTSFEYRLHPIGEIYGGPIFFAHDGDALRRFRDRIFDMPEQLGLVFGITRAAPLPFLPREWHGKPVSAAITCWTGARAQGEKIIEAIKTWGRVVGAYVAPMPYPTINTLFDELLPTGLLHHWKANFSRDLPEEAIEVHERHGKLVGCSESGTFLFPMDGAFRKVMPEDSAFAYRDASFSTIIAGTWKHAHESADYTNWVREYYKALEPYSEQGGYVNFMSGDDADRVRINYGENFERLSRIKAEYDPENVFHLNQNIKPAIERAERRAS